MLVIGGGINGLVSYGGDRSDKVHWSWLYCSVDDEEDNFVKGSVIFKKINKIKTHYGTKKSLCTFVSRVFIKYNTAIFIKASHSIIIIIRKIYFK